MGDSGKILKCGLVMPISPLDGCSAEHWAEIKSIIEEAIALIDDPIFDAKLVSDADDVGVIQKRIIQNIYSSDIIVCDVSGKNPNVMFELGMRLAFDKPAVIIKDDKTNYSFDTGVIEHISYPRDLRFSQIVAFKNSLADKVRATHQRSISDPSHSTFLKNFGTFQVASLNEEVVSAEKLVLEGLSELRREVAQLRTRVARDPRASVVGKADVGKRIRAKLEIREAIKKWMAEFSRSPNDLADNQELYMYLEDAVHGPAYFPTREEFRAAVDEEIISLLG